MEQNKIIYKPLECIGDTQSSVNLSIWKPNSKFIDGKLNTSEFIYKLNLPSIEERFNDQGLRLLDIVDNTKTAYTMHLVDNVFKPEWVNWHGIHWVDITRFYKNNFTGRIHDDGSNNLWGINWVIKYLTSITNSYIIHT